MSTSSPTMPARRLHVVICNERLLPRFGVDRVLLRLGSGLIARGHRITFISAWCDHLAVESVSPAIVELPELRPLGIHEGEAEASCWISEHWGELPGGGAPDVIITGGWPFYGVVQVCRRLGVPSLFIDAGAVPHDGIDKGAAGRQRELRRVRASTLPHFTAVLPVSMFIRDSQTLPDRGTIMGVQTVLHGANHLDEPMFAPASGAADMAALAALRKLTAAGRLPIMLLGRFEAEGYKNSRCAYDVLARILEHEPRARLLVLARAGELAPPTAVEHAVVPIDFVSDVALNTIMRDCRLGLSVSLWEGFNLPLAEMQWAGRPVLTFSIGAHPEVSLDPWLLCGSVAEMVDKAVRLLREGLPPHLAGGMAFARFRERFQWHDKIAHYSEVIEALAAARPPPAAAKLPDRRLVLVDCTNAAVDPANPGVIRVTRRLGHVLQQDPLLFMLFVRWDINAQSYRTLTSHEWSTLATYSGPADGFSLLFSQAGQGVWPLDNIVHLFDGALPPVLFLPEVVLDGRMPERLLWARARSMAVGALLHDIIPMTHRVLCSPNVVARFPEYLEGLAACDAIWANSDETLRQFELYVARHSLPCPAERMAIWLPAQFGAEPRVTAESTPPDGGEILMLCIGSIEPRKNHRSLIDAFRAVLARRPDLPLRLMLVGHRFDGADALANWVASIICEEPRITWIGLVPDAELCALIRRSAFTVYPSLVEGYGLPVVESLWLGRPCLCHDGGVMAELAAAGGCYTVDMNNPLAIAQGIEVLADDGALRQRLMEQALRRRLSDWATYGARIAGCLRGLRAADPLSPPLQVEAAATVTLDARHAALRQALRQQAGALRELPQRFVRITDVPVNDEVPPASG
jgi:glycosyltransferase involved in cell wall biosynthesis